MSSLDYDYTQKWSDLLASMEKPAMTANDEKKHKERKARELRIMLERAEIALEGNRRLVGMKRSGLKTVPGFFR